MAWEGWGFAVQPAPHYNSASVQTGAFISRRPCVGRRSDAIRPWLGV